MVVNTKKNRMLKKMNVLGFLENKRYEDSRRRAAFNCSHQNLSADERLFTQFLLSMANHQIGLQRLKDVGGYVFSDMVYRFSRQGILPQDLADYGTENSTFFRSFKDSEGQIKHAFFSAEIPNETICNSYKEFSSMDEYTLFSTLHCMDDAAGTLWGFTILQDLYGRSFTKFLLTIIEMNVEDVKAMLDNLVYGLYLLVTAKDDGESFTSMDVSYILSRTKEVEAILQDKELFQEKAKRFAKAERVDKKYLVTNFLVLLQEGAPYHKDFLAALEELKAESSVMKAVKSKEAFLAQNCLEVEDGLGNVFYECITKDNDDNTWKEVLSNPFLTSRVSLMCRNATCSICPFEAVSDEKALADLKRICVNDVDKYCTVAKVFAGYLVKCDGEDCSLKKALDF